MGQFIAFENNISEAPTTLWEGSLRELFLPSLLLASRQWLSSEMRTQSKMQGILEMVRFIASTKKAIAQKCAMAFLAPATGIEPITNP